MNTIRHIQQPDGSPKCGSNVYWSTIFKKDEAGKYVRESDGSIIPLGKEKSIRRIGVYFSDAQHPASCKRCLNKIERPVEVAVKDDMVGKVFHHSYGYDMTINEYCKVIKQDGGKLWAQECYTNTNGLEYGPSGLGKATAGRLKEGAKPRGRRIAWNTFLSPAG